jgi:CheY-like chemotaxis protein
MMAAPTPLILLVDDFEDATDIYATCLRHVGYDVECAASGLAALAAARARRPDLILLDIRMPGMSGTEVMTTLRRDADFRAVPIVALTAHAFDNERDAALAAGFDAVIAKPCLPDALLALVEDVLRRWGRAAAGTGG